MTRFFPCFSRLRRNSGCVTHKPSSHLNSGMRNTVWQLFAVLQRRFVQITGIGGFKCPVTSTRNVTSYNHSGDWSSNSGSPFCFVNCPIFFSQNNETLQHGTYHGLITLPLSGGVSERLRLYRWECYPTVGGPQVTSNSDETNSSDKHFYDVIHCWGLVTQCLLVQRTGKCPNTTSHICIVSAFPLNLTTTAVFSPNHWRRSICGYADRPDPVYSDPFQRSCIYFRSFSRIYFHSSIYFHSFSQPLFLWGGGPEMPHDQQQSQIVLLVPHQNEAKQGRRCSHATWSLDELWVAFPWV